jgi:hypothetical protein
VIPTRKTRRQDLKNAIFYLIYGGSKKANREGAAIMAAFDEETKRQETLMHARLSEGETYANHFAHPDNVTRLDIKPASFDVTQRREAQEKATEMGRGLVMELGTSTTRYYADADVPVGKIDVYSPREYKGMSLYEITLDHYDEDWIPKGHRDLAEMLAKRADEAQTRIENRALELYPPQDGEPGVDRNAEARAAYVRGVLDGKAVV